VKRAIAVTLRYKQAALGEQGLFHSLLRDKKSGVLLKDNVSTNYVADCGCYYFVNSWNSHIDNITCPANSTCFPERKSTYASPKIKT